MDGQEARPLIRRIAPEAAAIALAGCEGLDPRGMSTPADLEAMAHHGCCFALVSGQAGAVYVFHVRNRVVWIDALKGNGDVDLVQLVDEAVTAQAKGMQAIALQTKRPGLVKKLERRGYRVTGWVLRKELS